MSNTGSSATLSSTLLSSSATLITNLTVGLDTAYHAAITTVASWGISEFLKLGAQEVANMNTSIKHFLANVKAGATWGSAMSSMLTELWADTKAELVAFVTDFMEAVGKLLQSTGLIPASA